MSDTTYQPQQPFQSAIQDPFAPQGVSNTSQPGALGVSPDVWRSIAGFGANLATAANARTGGGWLQYGNGFLPLVGAAVGQSQQQGLQRGNEMAEMALRSAQARGAQLQNYVTQMQLPFQQAKMQQGLQFMQDPQGFMQRYGMSPGSQPLGAPSAPPPQGQTAQGNTPTGGSAFSNGIAQMESHGQANATNPLWAVSQGGPLGPHQFTGDTWLGFARENPQYFQGKSTPEILAMRTDPQLSATATEWYSAKNSIALKAQGIAPTPANLGIAHALGGAGAANLLRMPDNTPIGQIMPQIIRQNPQYAQMTVGDLKAKYAGLGAPTWMANPPTLAATPGQMAQAKPFQPGAAPQQAGAQPAPAPQQAAQNLPVPPIPPQGGQDVPVPNGNGLVRHPDGTVGTPGGGFGGQAAPQAAQEPGQQAAAAPQPAPYKEASVNPTAPPTSQGFAPPQPKAATQPPQQTADGTPPAPPPQAAPAPQPPQAPQVTPQLTPPNAQALAQAQAYEQQANMIEMARSYGVPVPGDPQALRQAAQQWRAYAISGAQAASEAAGKAGVELQYAGPTQAAKTDNTITTDRNGNRYRGNTYIGRGPEVKQVYDPQTDTYRYGDVGGLDANGRPMNYTGSESGPAGGGQAGAPGGQAAGAGGAPIAAPGPQSKEFATERGKDLAEVFHKVDQDADSAKESNYLFDNLRNDSQSWDMGKFASIEGDARAWLSATAQAFGVDTSSLNDKLADYQAFNKSSGMLLRTAVHDTSSRAAVQEFKLIGDTLPVPTTSKQGFGQVADQWQALNDFRLAKQQYMQSYKGNPQDFAVSFNTAVSPTSFLLNRMSMTPEGQHDMQSMLSRMQTTPEGRMIAKRMLTQYQYAKQNGLFTNLQPTAGQ